MRPLAPMNPIVAMRCLPFVLSSMPKWPGATSPALVDVRPDVALEVTWLLWVCLPDQHWVHARQRERQAVPIGSTYCA